MSSNFNHPVLGLAALGAASGGLGTFALGFGIGDAPQPGLHMILAGVWFGLVVGFGVWKWGRRTWTEAAIAVVVTWVAWELAVNLALQLDSNWLKMIEMPDTERMYVAGFAAGALGAFVTWAGVAWLAPPLRRLFPAVAFAAIGAVFGLLLPLTNNYDSPAVLLLPWQTAVSAVLGFCLAFQHGSRGTALPHCPHPPSG